VVRIKRQRRRGLHAVHQIWLQQFRKSVLGQGTLRTASGRPFRNAMQQQQNVTERWWLSRLSLSHGPPKNKAENKTKT